MNSRRPQLCPRVHAVTGRNKLLRGAISVLIAAQLIVGIYFAVVDGTGPSELLNRLFVRMLPHRSSVQPPPETNSDVYNVCIPRNRQPAVVAFSSVSVAFGTPLASNFQHEFTLGALMSSASRAPLCCGIADLLRSQSPWSRLEDRGRVDFREFRPS